MHNKKVFKFIFFLFFVSVLQVAYCQTNWTKQNTPRSRVLNCVKIVNFNNVCIVGGNKTNDSILTLHVSHNSGNSWNMISDYIHPWLTSVYFPTSEKAIAVGDYGTIIKSENTGDTWSSVPIPSGVQNRHFSSVHFTGYLTGYIVGGSQNENKTTILKTQDGGNTWTIQKDENGEVLNSVYFTNSNNGWAVGNNGLVLHTTDAGNTWSAVTIPGNAGSRNYRSVFFINDQKGFIVGGKYSNDSIQTILYTENNGNSWNTITDQLGSILNSVHFINENTGYAVGRSGCALMTTDGGQNWNQLALPDLDVNHDFNSVHFMNLDYGYIVGTGGICYRYYNPIGQSPLAVTQTASEFNLNSIKLNGLVNANGYPTQVEFEYGTSTNYTGSVPANMNPVTGNLNHQVNAVITGLLPNTMYYYRIKASNAMGTTPGDNLQFYTGSPEIPNFDFENWDTTYYIFPDGYEKIAGDVSRIETPCHGSYAILLKSDSSSVKPAGMLMGLSEDGVNFSGGQPFHSRPDSIKACVSYNFSSGDSGFVALVFKNNGQIISYNIYYISGSSNNNYEELTFPIYYTTTDMPDTVIFGVLNSSFLTLDSVIPGNYIALDYIRFTGTAETLLNNDFEDWSLYPKVTLSWWNYYKKEMELEPYNLSTLPITISDIYHNGQYSARIQNHVYITDTVQATMQCDTFALSFTPRKLTGHYYFQPTGNDTLAVDIYLFHQGFLTGHGGFSTTNSTAWFTPFEAQIDYPYAETPDSAVITISINNGINVSGNTYALVDDLNFDSFLLNTEKNPLTGFMNKITSLIVYPNPANDYFTVELSNSNKTQDEVMVIINNLNGKNYFIERWLLSEGLNRYSINTMHLPDGIYSVTVTGKSFSESRKILIVK